MADLCVDQVAAQLARPFRRLARVEAETKTNKQKKKIKLTIQISCNPTGDFDRIEKKKTEFLISELVAGDW